VRVRSPRGPPSKGADICQLGIFIRLWASNLERLDLSAIDFIHTITSLVIEEGSIEAINLRDVTATVSKFLVGYYAINKGKEIHPDLSEELMESLERLLGEGDISDLIDLVIHTVVAVETVPMTIISDNS
jgi:hypothetical protein